MTLRISGWCIRTATDRFTAAVRLLGYVDCLSRVPGDWYARFCGEGVIAILPPYPTRYAGLAKALAELRTYIVNNRHLIPNYGERYRNGEPIATGFVESTVNEVVSKRFCKKQQMQWSKEGAHLLLQTRVRTLNGELAGLFKRWYPD